MSQETKETKSDYVNIYERIITNIAFVLKQLLPFLVLVIISFLIAQASVTRDKFMLLPVMALIGAAGGIFLLRNRKIFYWIIVISSPMNDHLAIPLGGANLRPYNLLGMLGVAWFLLVIMRDEETGNDEAPSSLLATTLPTWYLSFFQSLNSLCDD